MTDEYAAPCGYRGIFGGCMANPGYSCFATLALGDCLKERENVQEVSS